MGAIGMRITLLVAPAASLATLQAKLIAITRESRIFYDLAHRAGVQTVQWKLM